MQKYDPEAITVDCCSKSGDFIDVITGVPVIYELSGESLLTKDSSEKQYYLDADGNETELSSTQVAILPGLEAFGDYNWILHNLRLPTAANYYPWSPANRMGENPVPGQVYTQFIIRLKKDRDGIAGEVVGQRATSVTTHVLYVAGKHTQGGTPAKAVYDKL
jgi:hypothetical protein